jgi:PAS domain S-box-containing protein
MSKEQKGRSDTNWLETIFHHSPEGIVLQDAEGIILEANESFARMCKHSLHSIIGKKISNLLCPVNKANWEHDLQKLIKGEWTNIEELCVFADGHKLPIRLEIISKTKYHGREVVILNIQNISAFYTFENALVAAQNQWELSFNAIADMMLILDNHGHILRANQAALQKMFAYQPDPIGLLFFDLFHIKGKEHEATALPDKMFTEHVSVHKVEFNEFKGSYNLFSYPITNWENKVTGCIAIIEDISEQVKQEGHIKRIEQSRQRSYRIEALGRLAAGIAHDFNNMLTTLMGYVSLVLQSESIGPNDRNCLIEIMRTIERGTALVRQLFDFSAERKEKYKTINVNTVIHNMQKMLAQILGANISIVTRLDQRLWNVNADVPRIERIIMNLAANARDAMPSGGEFIIETINTVLDEHFCLNHPELKPGNYIVLEISDTGTGMTPEIQERIFEPFFSTKMKGKGLGLGLPSVYGIVRQFGGEIICYSQLGKGTTFKVYLPQSTDKIQEEKSAVRPAELPGGSETVLIVDDEIHIVSMLKQILSRIGYKVISATTSSQAITLCKEFKDDIHLVLSDIIMPDMNGVELITLMRELHPEIKAIFMSGYTTNMAIESMGMEKNMVFLQKPFTFEELAHKIRDSLKTNEKTVVKK